MIYFDCAATALPDLTIHHEAYTLSLEYTANPSSLHQEGKKAKAFVDNCREMAAFILGVDSSSIIFNSGATEGNQFIILQNLMYLSKGRIIINKGEHSSLYDNLVTLKPFTSSIKELSTDHSGLIIGNELFKALTPDTKMVIIMLVNNETGAVQPIKSLVEIVRQYQKSNGRYIHFHVDAVQAFGKINFDLTHLGCDSAVLSSHKVGGPRGSGLLYLKEPKGSFLRGGGQELNLRSGTENVFAHIGMALSLKKYYAITHLNLSIEAYLLAHLKKLGATINPFDRMASDNRYSPYIINCSFIPLPAEVLVRVAGLKGLMISTGSACANNNKHSSRSLAAMGISKKQAFSSVRISTSPTTTMEEAVAAISILKAVLVELAP